jgi:LysM repeat protein
VKFGDTLSSIAQKFGVTVAAIQKLNGIKDPRLIHPGQVLQIP